MQFLKQWKQDVKALETQVREVKLKLRNNWNISYPVGTYAGYDQTKLLQLKFTLTHLYAFRAGNRNKVHVEEIRNINNLKVPDLGGYIKLRDQELEQRKILAAINLATDERVTL